jgi:hypothetical protein
MQSFIAAALSGREHLTMLDLASRLATTGQLLVRSGIEIDRLLSQMVEDHATVTANLASQVIFLSRLVAVDPVKERVTVAYSDYKAANAALLSSPSVTFRCHHRWGQFAFQCTKPRQSTHNGSQAIEMIAPPIVVALQHRRRVSRSPVTPEPPQIYCELRMGPISFDARLVDMSVDGRAFLLGQPAIPVCAGTRLSGVKLEPRGRPSLEVDIDVNRVIPAVLPNGERATRLACKIIAPEPQMEQLIGNFIVDFA